MSRNRWKRLEKQERGRNVCDVWHEDDGIDPKLFFRTSRRRGQDRKTLQLCGQVSRTLSCILAECGEPRFYDLVIDSVCPAPDASRLAVTIIPMLSSLENQPNEWSELLSLLERNKSIFRAEIAKSISRKRVPDLMFQLILPQAHEEVECTPDWDESDLLEEPEWEVNS